MSKLGFFKRNDNKREKHRDLKHDEMVVVRKKIVKRPKNPSVAEEKQAEEEREMKAQIDSSSESENKTNIVNDEDVKHQKIIRQEKEIEKLLRNSFLKPFLLDEHITDISYNGTALWVQSNKIGRYKPKEQPTHDEVYRLGKQIADIQGKEFTTSSPILDTDLSYLRVNFVHHSASPSGCTFAIRVSKPRLVTTKLSSFANEDVAKLLEVLVKAEKNIIISGRTGAGKTELQKLLVNFIEPHKKITLMEDTMDSHIKELYPEKDINSWRTLTEDSREKKITFHDLIKAGLRNNPDWMIVAETRGSESYSVLESALTDHAIITTLHANGAGAIPSRLISMIGQSYQVNELLLGQDIVNTFRFGIYLTAEFTKQGIERYIREIVEFTDFTEKGAEYTPIYQVEMEYDEKTDEYKKVLTTNPLSVKTAIELRNKKLIHLVPKVFLPKGGY